LLTASAHDLKDALAAITRRADICSTPNWTTLLRRRPRRAHQRELDGILVRPTEIELIDSWIQ
jgi:hypothetical protein